MKSVSIRFLLWSYEKLDATGFVGMSDIKQSIDPEVLPIILFCYDTLHPYSVAYGRYGKAHGCTSNRAQSFQINNLKKNLKTSNAPCRRRDPWTIFYLRLQGLSVCSKLTQDLSFFSMWTIRATRLRARYKFPLLITSPGWNFGKCFW